MNTDYLKRAESILGYCSYSCGGSVGFGGRHDADCPLYHASKLANIIESYEDRIDSLLNDIKYYQEELKRWKHALDLQLNK
jgi:hypothetical protein